MSAPKRAAVLRAPIKGTSKLAGNKPYRDNENDEKYHDTVIYIALAFNARMVAAERGQCTHIRPRNRQIRWKYE
jgi:hypothetical protein